MPVSRSRQESFGTENWMSCGAIHRIRSHYSLHPFKKPWRRRAYCYKKEMNVDLNTSQMVR